MNIKVRKDFNPAKEYSVDVSECTEEEKKEVQQAFFNAGFPWGFGGDAYRHLDAVVYTNTMTTGRVTPNLMCGGTMMCGSTVARVNMTAKEFLDLVYEPEQAGHVHAELMAQYAEDAKTHAEPWKLWQLKGDNGVWNNVYRNPSWFSYREYRRKPKTHIVNGVEIPDLRFTPKFGEHYCYPSPQHPSLAFSTNCVQCNAADEHRIKNGLCYESSEEGLQAAILHAKAMLCLVQ